MILKEQFLNSNLFLENKYLAKYIKLINSSSNNLKNYSEQHHIFPKSYYRYLNLPIDNTPNNIVRLSCKDHCLAHWYLFKCTTGKLKGANCRALIYLINTKNSTYKLNELTEQDIIELAKLRLKAIAAKATNYYTNAEINFLRKNYPTKGGAYCAEYLKRSPAQIRSKASLLNIKCNKTHHPKAWTLEEDFILKKFYVTEGTKVYRRFKNRTGVACRTRANKLNLTRAWTEAEVKLLKKYFPTEGILVYKLFKNRSKQACKQMAHKLGLKSGDVKHWTKQEDTKLINLYVNQRIPPYKLLGEFPNRSIRGIRRRIERLGLYKQKEKKINA